MFAILFALVSAAHADDVSEIMTLRITCEGGCADITINGNDIDAFPVTTEIKFDESSDVLTIKVDNGQSWIVAPKEGRHTLRIFDNPGMPTFITSDTLSVLVNNPLVSVTQELVPYLSLPIAECWYEDAQKVPGTNQRDWTIHEGIGCRWMVRDPEAVVTEMPKDAMLIARYGHNHTGDEGHDTPGELDTNVQAIESQARGWDIITWADTELHKELPAWPDTRASLPERKSELWVMIPKSTAIAAAMPHFDAPPPYDPCPSRPYKPGKTTHEVSECIDIPAPTPAARKLRWEAHGLASIGVSAPAIRAGVGLLLPQGEGGWLHIWGDFGLTPDRSSADGKPSVFNLWQSGFAPPVASWGVGGAYVGPKGLTLGAGGEAFRMTTSGWADVYDVSGIVGYTGFFGDHGFFRLAGGPSLTYGHVPDGEVVVNTLNWKQFTYGPATFWEAGVRADARVGIVF